MSIVSRRLLLLSILPIVLVACGTFPSTPTPTPTPPDPPTSTALPPTATVAPTATSTPAPKAKIKDILLAIDPELNEAQGENATFDFGMPALYALVDFEGIPSSFPFSWTLTRAGRTVADGSAHPDQAAGTLTLTVAPDGPLLPGNYRLSVRAFNQIVDRRFKIAAEQLAKGTTILTEDFHDNSNAWDPFSASYGTTKIADGKMRINIMDRDSWVSGRLDLDMTDLDLAVDVSFDGPPDAAAYIFFRAAERSGYVFSLAPDGSWSVSRVVGDDYRQLRDWEQSTAFKRSQDNRVRIIATGSRMAFYLNDVLLGTLSDSAYSHGAIRLGAGSGDATGIVVTFDDLVIETPAESVALLPTSAAKPVATARPQATQAASATTVITPGPTATRVPAQLPLRDAIVKARDATEAIGGAMDRIYHGGGAEACAPFLASYSVIVNSPAYDVATQPSNVQGAYALYRQGVELVPASKIAYITQICQQGGGVIGNLDFNEARQTVNTAGGLFTQALATLAQ